MRGIDAINPPKNVVFLLISDTTNIIEEEIRSFIIVYISSFKYNQTIGSWYFPSIIINYFFYSNREDSFSNNCFAFS